MADMINADDRYLDATAANLIAVSDKVRQIADGKIPLPEVVELFLTNYCSFACPHCRCARYHGDTSQALDFITLSRLLDELLEKGVTTLELGGGGEPLEHPTIEEILRLLGQKGFHVGLITNGYRLTQQPRLIDLLLDCADWVRISLDGVSDEVYRVVHGRRDVSYRVLRETLAEMVRRVEAKPGIDRRPKIGIKLIVQRANQHQLIDAVAEALDLGVHYLQFKWLEHHPWSLAPEERPALAEQLRDRLRNVPRESLFVDVLPGYGGPKVQERCLVSVLHPLIDWDGAIYLCAFFHHRKEGHSIGNITRSRFFDCWGSPLHQERIRQVDPQQCVANCPLLRYTPIVKFIIEEGFRFRYI